MAKHYIEDEKFERKQFNSEPLPALEYENCTFHYCDFTDCDLSGYKFMDCEFHGCNMSLVKCVKTALRNVKFNQCKMLGWRFDLCNDFGFSVRFEGCQLNHSSFHQLKIKKTVFIDTQLREVDFSSCDLSGSIFESCDLSDALFENTVLIQADFRTAIHYHIDPEMNQIKKARFSLSGVEGLLRKYQIEIV